jgi:putative ABC transport system permease protein
MTAWLADWPRRLLSRWRLLTGLGRGQAFEDRLREELAFHLAMETEKNLRAGMSPEEARRAAVIAFGPRQRFAEESRAEARDGALFDLGRDLRHATRALRRSPTFAAAAVLTLALGIGATTVVFTVVDHIVLRPLPYPDSGRLVLVRETIAELQATYPSLPANASHFLEWRRQCRLCGELAAIRQFDLTLTGLGDPERLAAIRATPSLFRILGAQFALGRSFADPDDHPGSDRVVVVSEAFWRGRLGADPAAIGRAIILDDQPFVVVGVVASSFRLPKGRGLGEMFTLPPDVSIIKPLALQPWEATSPGDYSYAVIARTAAGTTTTALGAELNRIAVELSRRAPDKATLSASVVSLEAQVLGSTGRAMLLLLGAVAMMLLVVAVNLASLLLARHAARTHESAVRLALGASRQRLIQYALSEALVLAVVGGAVGIGLATGGLRTLLALAPASLPRLEEVRFDGRVLVVALVLSAMTWLGFGLLPAFRLSGTDPADTLKSAGRSVTDDRRGRRGRAWFIAAQVALTTVLLAGTGLFLSSFVRVLKVDKGFSPERVLAANVVLSPVKYRTGASRQQFYQQVRERLAASPGVERAAVTSWPPLEGETQVDMLSHEHDPRPALERPLANIRYVSPDYFAVVGTPVLRGRPFAEGDLSRRIVLSERAARALIPREDALGRWIVPGSNDSLSEVIGIAIDARTSSLERDGAPIAYLPLGNTAPPAASLLVRTAGDPAELGPIVRAAVREVDPTVPVARIRTLSEVVSAAIAQRRFQLALLGGFGLVALITAAVGLYGVVAGSVARRLGEIGIRMAFGASRGTIHKLVLGEGLAPVVIGLLVGVVATIALGRTFSALLFGIRPSDPLTLGAVVLILGAVAAVACYLPARRATSLDPVTVLRAD